MTAQTALILFSHGSLLDGSDRFLQLHVEALRRNTDYIAVEPGFLNFDEPAIEVAARRCIDAGASTIIVAPYFLVSGKFVLEDLPPRLDAVRAEHPAIRFIMAEPLGDHEAMIDAVRHVAGEAMHPGQWQQLALVPEVNLTRLPQMNVPTTTIPDSETGLLLILHGSPRPEANAPALRIAAKLSDSYGRVIVGYLECNDPDVPTAIEQFAAANIQRLIVVPYFLHPGRHLVLDIPGHLLEAMQKHPRLEILLSNAVGLSSQVTQVLIHRAQEAR